MNNKLEPNGLISDHGHRHYHYHLVGIGGIGMSAIAQLLRAQGHTVSGSDRNHDRELFPQLFSALSSQGIKLSLQDGSGVNGSTDYLVVSSAIEDDNPDIKKARENDVPIIKRADLLAEIFNNLNGIAIGGTNGKTTVSGMVGWILDYAGLDPTIIIGGYIKGFTTGTMLGNTRVGKSSLIAIETDESDGSVVGFRPKVGVITNISKDHKPIDELLQLFSTFADNTVDTLVINADCPTLGSIDFSADNIITYGTGPEAKTHIKDVLIQPHGSRFKANDTTFELNVQGAHNVSNAAAAISVAMSVGISDDVTAEALKTFKGISRRMDLIGEVNGIKVIDDYAHNPAKIMAALDTARLGAERLIAVFQPHGYGPTNFMKEEFIAAFKTKLTPTDVLFMPEIFYAGGTANKNISSSDIVDRLCRDGLNAVYVPDKDGIVEEISKVLSNSPTTTILVMGARDDTLTSFCHNVVKKLQD